MSSSSSSSGAGRGVDEGTAGEVIWTSLRGSADWSASDEAGGRLLLALGRFLGFLGVLVLLPVLLFPNRAGGGGCRLTTFTIAISTIRCSSAGSSCVFC